MRGSRNQTNRTAITERGWGPLNVNLMLDRTFRSTMTDSEKDVKRALVYLYPHELQNTPRPPPLQPLLFYHQQP